MAEQVITIRLSAIADDREVDRFAESLRRAGYDANTFGNRARNASNNTQGLAREFSGLQGALATVGFAVGAREMLELGVQTFKSGMRVRAASATFYELAGGVETATARLEEMREATQNQISDQQLRELYNTLKLTLPSATDADIVEMIGQTRILGGALGDVQDGFANLGAALRNASYERLDSLGVSASRVRERVAELKAEGMDMGAAFAQATREEMTAAVERLGSSIDASVSSVATLETRWTNAVDVMSAKWAGLVEQVGLGVLNFADLGAALLDPSAQGEAFRAEFANQVPGGDVATEVFRAGVGISTFGVADGIEAQRDAAMRQQEEALLTIQRLTGEPVAQAQIEAFYGELATTADEFYLANGRAAQSVEELYSASLALGRQDFYTAEQILLAEQFLAANGDVATAMAGVGGATAETTEQMREQQLAMARLEAQQQEMERANQLRQGADSARALAGAWFGRQGLDDRLMGRGDNLNTFATDAMRMVEQARQMEEARRAAFAGLDALAMQAGGAGGVFPDVPEYLTQASADTAQQIADAMRDAAENIRDAEWATEDDVQRADEIAQRAAEFAEDAQAAAGAFADLTLQDIFGQGARNEVATGLAGAVMEEAQTSGQFTEEELAALNTELGLYTGEITNASLAFQDEVVPALLELRDKLGDSAFTAALQGLESAFQNGALAGLSPEQQLAGSNSAIWGGIGSMLGEQASGLFSSAVSAVSPASTGVPETMTSGEALGTPLEQQQQLELSAANYSNSLILATDTLGEMSIPVEPMAGLASEAGRAQQAAAAIRGDIEFMSSRIHNVQLRITATAPAWLTQILTLGIGTVVRDGGGSVPGAGR